MTREIMTAKQLAEYLGIGVSTVRKMTREGEIPFARLGSRIRYKRSVIDSWMERKIEDQTESRQVREWCEDKMNTSVDADPVRETAG